MNYYTGPDVSDGNSLDGRGYINVNSENDPKYAYSAHEALVRSKRLADRAGVEWTVADAYEAIRDKVRRKYR